MKNLSVYFSRAKLNVCTDTNFSPSLLPSEHFSHRNMFSVFKIHVCFTSSMDTSISAGHYKHLRIHNMKLKHIGGHLGLLQYNDKVMLEITFWFLGITSDT